MKSITNGVSLIEVMVSLIILSVIISLSSRFISAEIQQPYISGGIEQWINFVEESSNGVLFKSSELEIQHLTKSSDLFNGLDKPVNLDFWTLEWESSNLYNTSVVQFSAKTSQGKEINWQVFKKLDQP